MAMSNKSTRVRLLWLTAVLASPFLAGCCGDVGSAYSQYCPTGNGGWFRDDTLHLTLGPLRHGGRYAEEVGLRTDSRYPFMQIAMIVDQKATPSGFCRSDTLNVQLTDEMGYFAGEGISHYQYLFPIGAATLDAGDTLHVDIRQRMVRSPLQGVTDVGLAIRITD